MFCRFTGTIASSMRIYKESNMIAERQRMLTQNYCKVLLTSSSLPCTDPSHMLQASHVGKILRDLSGPECTLTSLVSLSDLAACCGQFSARHLPLAATLLKCNPSDCKSFPCVAHNSHIAIWELQVAALCVHLNIMRSRNAPGSQGPPLLLIVFVAVIVCAHCRVCENFPALKEASFLTWSFPRSFWKAMYMNTEPS